MTNGVLAYNFVSYQAELWLNVGVVVADVGRCRCRRPAVASVVEPVDGASQETFFGLEVPRPAFHVWKNVWDWMQQPYLALGTYGAVLYAVRFFPWGRISLTGRFSPIYSVHLGTSKNKRLLFAARVDRISFQPVGVFSSRLDLGNIH